MSENPKQPTYQDLLPVLNQMFQSTSEQLPDGSVVHRFDSTVEVQLYATVDVPPAEDILEAIKDVFADKTD